MDNPGLRDLLVEPENEVVMGHLDSTVKTANQEHQVEMEHQGLMAKVDRTAYQVEMEHLEKEV